MTNLPTCKNCNCTLAEYSNFCPSCGQKKVLSDKSFWLLMKDVFSVIFSMDSKLIRTLLPLWFKPGNLTQAYLVGKRQRFISPVRLFILALTFSMILLSFVTSRKHQDSDWENNKQVLIEHQRQRMRDVLLDTLSDPASRNIVGAVLAIDTTQSRSKGNNSSFLSKDFIVLSADELFQKANFDSSGSYWQQQLFYKFIKAVQNSNSFSIYIIGHISWGIIWSIPFLAVWLKLLYIRRKKFFVEHMVYLLHLYAFLLSLWGMLLIKVLWHGNAFEWGLFEQLLLAYAGLYCFLSIKKVYVQSVFKTILKSIVFLLGTAFILLIDVLFFVLITIWMY